MGSNGIFLGVNWDNGITLGMVTPFLGSSATWLENLRTSHGMGIDIWENHLYITGGSSSKPGLRLDPITSHQASLWF